MVMDGPGADEAKHIRQRNRNSGQAVYQGISMNTRVKSIILTAMSFLSAVAVSVGPVSAEGWTCSAPGMVSGSYDGGSSAYIHLSGFPDGGTYSVQKQGKRASGTTKNGTRFVCVQK